MTYLILVMSVKVVTMQRQHSLFFCRINQRNVFLINLTTVFQRYLSTSKTNNAKHKCKVLVAGGGTGGCSTAAKLVRTLGNNNKGGDLIIVEPADDHYYQSLFTLVGAGIYDVSKARRSMARVLPKNATWLKDRIVHFDPEMNRVTIGNGDVIEYELLLIALGLQTNYDQIPGLVEALTTPNSGVCSNYSPKYVARTYETLKQFQGGNAIFTYPNTAVKCPGGPQKIMYLTDDYLRKVGKRDKANIIYNTSLGVLFGVKTYADALWLLCNARNINVNLRTNLIEVRAAKREAVFENLDQPDQKPTVLPFEMLHVTPPMGTPDALNKCTALTNAAGFVEVNPATMQHIRYANVFAIGDCSSSPNSKTAAAAAAQCGVVYANMLAVMTGNKMPRAYDGYASCPLVTGYHSCILAEFDYALQPLETFPFRQDRERYSMFLMKKLLMPQLYWHLMLNGFWNGPAFMRNLMHLKLKF